MVESVLARPKAAPEAKGKVAPPGIPQRSGWFVVRRTVRRFGQDRGFASASTLTLQTLLAALATVVALLGALAVVASGDRVAGKVAGVLSPVLSTDAGDRVRRALDAVAASGGGWAVLGAGALAAVLSVVGYAAAVRVATNKAWQVAEGRPAWRLAGIQLLVGLAAYALGGIVLLLLLSSGSMAEPLVGVVGLYPSADELAVWSYAVWPLVGVVLILLAAVLHRGLPNVRFGRTRLITPGSFLAIVLWLAASAGVAIYLARYRAWSPVLGTVVGTVVAVGVVLLWLWVLHAALVLGSELDAELERGRELQAGQPAEEHLQVGLRDDRTRGRAEIRERRAVERMRAIRVAAASHGNPDDRPFGRR